MKLSIHTQWMEIYIIYYMYIIQYVVYILPITRTIFNSKNELKSNNNLKQQMTIDTIWNISVDNTIGEYSV